MNDFATELAARFESRTEDHIDVVILGGGINGAGLFRDLSLQGINCLIVDKADFASGTSAAPSRLIHGGLKYLETGEFGLVAQSTLERNLLLVNAPHSVEPLPTFIPVFSWTRGIWAALRTFSGSTTAPRSRGAVLIKIGLALYDFYGARNRIMPRHSLLLRRRAMEAMPHITPSIVAGGIYYDAKISRPERLVFELVRDGLAENPGALAANATSLVSSEGGLLSFRRADGSTFAVRPKLVINAAGPWIDRVNAALGAPSRLIGGTKGSHILLDHPELVKSLNGRMIYFEADDGRICLVFGYLGLAMVGSTDIPADNPDTVRCEDDETEYLLASLRSLLPDLAFDRSQIAYTYSGIRPLPASDATAPGLISRDHSAPVAEPVPDRPFAIISLVGGKWTTFRGFAEEVADSVLARLGRSRRHSTRNRAIGGGRDYPAGPGARQTWTAELSNTFGISTARAGQLLARYGTTAGMLLAGSVAGADDVRLPDVASYSRAEIDWIAKNEMVVHLADIILRRTTLAIEGSLTRADLERVADFTAAALGWGEARKQDEIADVVRVLEDFHAVTLGMAKRKG